MMSSIPKCIGAQRSAVSTRVNALARPVAVASVAPIPARSQGVTSTSGRCLAPPPRAAASTPGTPGSGAGAAAREVEVDSVETPLSPEDIMRLVQQQEDAAAAGESDQLVAQFRDDPEGLYEYVERAYAEGPRRVTTPISLLQEEMTGIATESYPAAVANDIVGMGTWRLKDDVDPVIEFLVARLEGCWREILDTDLCLYPREKWKEQGWDLVDSMDPTQELEGFSYADIPDPAKGEEGYPRLQLENRVYCSKVFRKLHVEVGLRQDGLQVLHVVIYPRYSYDMPIFGMDIVMVDGRVTLAVVDCCPVRADLKLQPHYMETMALLQRTFMEGTDPAARRIPEWGSNIFSPLALCISPSGPEELAAFAKYAVALHRAYLAMSLNAVPVVAGPGDRREAARLQEIRAGQKRFCDNQLVNKKTRRVLEVAMGAEWTDAYMSQLMFDFDPEYEPPYFDASFEKLYTYFDENPEFGDMADEAMALERGAEAERANEAMAAALSGRAVSREKLAMAMGFLYQNDATFRAAVQTLSGGEVAEGDIEERLTDDLMQLLERNQA
ncbi:hypothetical protein HXX76_001822 [Chlamydomonas incerta]|uniref:Phycocyanobilin:ferredoxin oxidoreductase n=2 Tax=Chlamydomonas incerta TaxID=51695 RepID=A0A835TQB1_CHLIN|nr:hypothetical protein HXX76_001822 [Chlamydomonas incerta]|eukprot:KAG2443466.1 hypothetical protein HXX76_001822 [Chlamydomonas incerta]